MKTPVLESLFNKVAGLQPWTLFKKDSNIEVSCKYCKTLRTAFFIDLFWWLLLNEETEKVEKSRLGKQCQCPEAATGEAL